MKKCPNCKILCDDTALVCDCGFGFASGKAPPGTEKGRSPAPQALIHGLILFGVAYAVQLLAIPLKQAAVHLASLALYGVSFFYLIRSVIFWASAKGKWSGNEGEL